MRNSQPKQDNGHVELYHIMWRLNQLCNYQCAYCFRNGVDKDRLKEHSDCGKHSPERIAECFDNTQKTWRIHMTGGEPFLYPKFIDLAKALARNHQLSINTNLSTSNVYDFANEIPAPQVHAINASAHILELEKRNNATKSFLDKFLFLQDKGFRVKLLYITYPPLLDRLEKDIAYFKAEGVENLTIKIFRGQYEEQFYPTSYSEKQVEFIKSLGLSRYESAILACKDNFKGRFCLAGHKAFNMDISGNLTKCCTIEQKHGNLFEENYHFDNTPIPCPAITCICPYQGMKFTVKTPLYFYMKKVLKKFLINH